MSRDFIQRLVGEKARLAFGPASMTTEERSKRVGEEAIELMQAGGVSLEDAMKLVIYVYGRPAGVLQQEIGGVCVTLLALCAVTGYSLEFSEQLEVERFLMKDISYWQERVKAKAAAGVATYGAIINGVPATLDEVKELIESNGPAYIKDPQSEW